MTTRMIVPTVFDEMRTLREAMNDVFDFSPVYTTRTANRSYTAALNVYEDAKNFYVMALLPGVDPAQVEISLKENTLNISGEYGSYKWPETTENLRTLLAEIPTGKFARQVRLPGAVNFDGIEARSTYGLLLITMPKSEASQVRRISVQNANPQLN